MKTQRNLSRLMLSMFKPCTFKPCQHKPRNLKASKLKPFMLKPFMLKPSQFKQGISAFMLSMLLLLTMNSNAAQKEENVRALQVSKASSSRATDTAQINIELALKSQTGQYHPPYVASWIENAKGQSVRTLLLWREQAKWLKDIRRWWRKVGKKDAQLVDGVTSATRAAGHYPLSFLALDDQQNPLIKGEYTLYIEVVREKGGRAIMRQPFTINGEINKYTLAPTHETDAITLTVIPE